MQTFIKARDFVHDPDFSERRKTAVAGLPLKDIDEPIRDLIRDISKIQCCYSLQCCRGHFPHPGQPDRNGLEPLTNYSDDTQVEYKIAYLALCIQNSEQGRGLFGELKDLAARTPDYIQFGSAEWFWNQCVNTYAIQVEPERFMYRDTAVVPIQEALRIEQIRNRFFPELENVISQFI